MIIAVLSVVSLGSFARPQTRTVVVDTVCEAPIQDLLPVIKRFCYEFQACPDSLFEWAYKNLGEPEVVESKDKSKESKDVIQLDYKDRTYDPKTKTGDVAIDIYVLGVRWWKDQHLGTKYTLTRPASAQYPQTAHLKATYITFGRVLSAFIGDKIWRNAIQWRFETILENLIEYTETGTVQKRPVGPKK